MATDLDLLSDHKRAWDMKPKLRESYHRYYDMLLAACPKKALVVELGCGIGGLGERARASGHTRFFATDLIASGNAGLQCNATNLPFRAASVERIVFVDVLHHLASPPAFFAEAARVLKPRGEVVAVEPWVTPLSYPIYRWIHQEGCDLTRDVDAPFSGEGDKPAYEGDAGLTTLVCRKLKARWHDLGFEAPRVRTFNDFAYLATRGLREGKDASAPVYAAARAILDDLLGPLSPLLGLRALIRWRRVQGAPP